MSGHSKWATIKRHKGAVDAKRGVVYAQASREISVAARLGGIDPNFNFRLRNAILRAKEVGMPNDNIHRAIHRFSSNKEAANLEEILYEGYGISGIAILVEVATDNRNRTAAELRLIFSRGGGNLGETGCVSWGFRRTGLISLSSDGLDIDQLLEWVSDLPVEDIHIESGQRQYLLLVEPENLEWVSRKLEAQIPAVSSELTYLPENTIQIGDGIQVESLEKLLQGLDEYDEVSRVHHNAEWS